MKKYILLLTILFFVTGCTDVSKKELNEKDNIKEKEEENIPEEPAYVDENPVVVGLYQNGRLISNTTIPFNINSDIASFDVYFTNEENVGSSNTKRNFTKYAANYENINNYKIGFMVSFETNDIPVNKVILKPKDTYILSPYIYNYLYDDVHQADGAWYSHIEELNENTVYSSIKLYATDKINNITSPITLTVFTYDTEDDFDEEGMYRGNSRHTVIINRK